MVNVQMNMNAAQIAMTAEMIVEKQWTYSLEDIQLCLDNGAMGIYGELYNRLDGSVIFGWFRKYEIERNEAIAKKRNEQIERNNIYETFQHPVMLDALKIVTEKLDEKKEVIPDPKPTELSPFESMVMSEWDALILDEKTNLKSYKERWFDFTDYRKFRYNEELEKQNEHND